MKSIFFAFLFIFIFSANAQKFLFCATPTGLVVNDLGGDSHHGKGSGFIEERETSFSGNSSQIDHDDSQNFTDSPHMMINMCKNDWRTRIGIIWAENWPGGIFFSLILIFYLKKKQVSGKRPH